MQNVSIRFGGLLLDFKLALRMLVKYPLLTIVGGVGMAFGIAAGVGGFEIRSQFVDPTLPLDEGRRIVGLRNWDVRSDRPAALSESDFRIWREQLHRLQELGAAALVERNLTVDGSTEPIGVAEMTASGFHIARVPPMLGRTLVEDDERPGATPVAVIGHALWQRRFSSEWLESQYMSGLLAVVSGLTLLLSLMAVYAVMAFMVTQRTREIGTRVALGADRWRVAAAIMRRPLTQISLGIGVGGSLVALLFIGSLESTPTSLEAGMIAAYTVLMLLVCLSACIVPIRRALRLELMQVLRAEG
jgi:hypothetical protein